MVPIDGGEHMLVLQEMMATVPPYYKETYIKQEYVEYCTEIGEEYDICPEILMALIEMESSGKADALSADGTCKGLCQMKESCHKDRMERLGVTDIYDPYGNILMCADFLTELGAKYQDIAIVLGRFHGESKAEIKVSNYTTWILERSEELEKAHGK